MQRTTVLYLVSLSTFGVFESAHAEAGTFSLEASAGLATPLGFGGLAAEYAPTHWFSFGAGLGIGAAGIQVAAMPRVSLRTGAFVAGIGVGLSGGPFAGDADFNIGHGKDREWDFAFWLNSEAFLGYAFSPTWGARLFGGYGYIFDKEADACSDSNSTGLCDKTWDKSGLPYAGVGITYFFGN